MIYKTKRHIRIVVASVIAILLVTLCTGCMGRTKESVVESINNCIPNIKDFSIAEEKFESGDTAEVFTFVTDEISFKYYEIQAGLEGGNGTTTKRETDYYQKIFELKKDDIIAAAERNNVKLLEEKFKQDSIDGANCCIYIEHGNGGKVTFYVYVENATFINPAFEFIKSTWTILEKYIPTQEGLCTSTMHINLYNAKAESLASQQELNMWGTIDLTEPRAWAKYEYEVDVLDGIIKDDTVNTDGIKPRTINKIYYNEGLLSGLESDKTFYYNPIDGKYYVLVCYGVNKNFDTTHPGYLHKEILETIYPNLSYEIVDSLKEKSSTYIINGDEFCIEWSKRDTSKGELIFHKNGTLLDIKTYTNIGPISNQTTDNRFISVEDFAKLMDLEVSISYNAIKFTRQNQQQ